MIDFSAQLSIAAVLKHLIEERGLNVSKLARKTGVLQPVLHRIVAGTALYPKIDTLVPLAKYFDVTLDELVGLAPLPEHEPSTQILKKKRAKNISTYYEVPLFTWEEMPGLIDKEYAIAQFVTRRKSDKDTVMTEYPISDKTFAVTLPNHSMAPRFNEGDILIVDQLLQREEGDFVLVNLDKNDPSIFKQFFIDGADRYLKSLNPDVKPLCIHKNDPCEWIGVVVESKQSFIKSSRRAS
jgi:SOS-response transcriptional repressor LexA